MQYYINFDGMNWPAYPDTIQYLEPRQATPKIEFTDLTAPYHEDRRRRRSTSTRDKDAISNMHMRRRAQNRASQRAFRERKEKHVQHLEHQLEDLELKHNKLMKSYSEMDHSNDKLKREVQKLRAEIESMRLSRDRSMTELMAPDAFDQLLEEQ